MKSVLLLAFPAVTLLAVNNKPGFAEKKHISPGVSATVKKMNKPHELNFGNQTSRGNISAIEFKNQDYCRAEAPDFEFETQFVIVSATAYFSGEGFNGNVQKATITGNSLKPLKELMKRCMPGTIVVFDDIKVLGPDKEVRTIQGVTYRLF